LKDVARTILPLLDAHEETQPYAAWLRSRLDYLETADELRRATPPPKIEPGKPASSPTNPPPALERKVWEKKLSQRPLPKGAEQLVPKLKQVFATQGVPTELIWLAEVESAFDRRAKSPAGAAGLFQLMPMTAKRYGLRRWPFDQRYQVEPSALAAAQYLKTLHKQFRDWPLAVAAYNAGEGRVGKLLAKHKARSFDAIASFLPAETQMYVPKVEATVLRREGVRMAKL
jgi:membrane-bound lytic murein transglycosylase D